MRYGGPAKRSSATVAVVHQKLEDLRGQRKVDGTVFVCAKLPQGFNDALTFFPSTFPAAFLAPFVFQLFDCGRNQQHHTAGYLQNDYY